MLQKPVSVILMKSVLPAIFIALKNLTVYRSVVKAVIMVHVVHLVYALALEDIMEWTVVNVSMYVCV